MEQPHLAKELNAGEILFGLNSLFLLLLLLGFEITLQCNQGIIEDV